MAESGYTPSSIREIYESKLASHGPGSSLSVGYQTPAEQEIRYRVLLSAIESVQTATILDVGCGLGYLLTVLKRDYRYQGAYTGFDLSPGLIKSARETHADAQFEVRDGLNDALAGPYDLIVACGVFAYRYEQAWETLERFLSQAHAALKPNGAVAVTLTSTYVNYRDPEWMYYEPERVYTLVKTKISPYLTIRSDYKPFDYTVIVYKK